MAIPNSNIPIPESAIKKLVSAQAVSSFVVTTPMISAFNFGLGLQTAGWIWFGVYALAFFYVKEKGRDIKHELYLWRLINEGAQIQGGDNGNTRN